MTKGRQVYSKISAFSDAAVFFDEVSMYWLTGFYSTDGIVIVDKESTKLCVDSRYIEAANISKSKGDVYDDVEVLLLDEGVYAAMKKYIKAKKVSFDSSFVTVSRLDRLKESFSETEFVAVNDICGEFRMIKSPDEVEKIKTAQSITDEAFIHILGFIREGVTEREIAAELEYFVKRNGGDNMAFDTIAVSGSNSSLPHGVPSDREIVKNSFITMDFGAKYHGYCSDMTRTVVFGKADDEMKRVYDTVLKAQLVSIAGVKAGMNGSDCHSLASKVISDQGYGNYFGHGLGHSLGIEIHESPRFSPKYESPIPADSVMTVEPGIYLPGKYGVRIEDMVLMTSEGCIGLTHSPKQLIEL